MHFGSLRRNPFSIVCHCLANFVFDEVPQFLYIYIYIYIYMYVCVYIFIEMLQYIIIVYECKSNRDINQK